jgi:hypothetical protein
VAPVGQAAWLVQPVLAPQVVVAAVPPELQVPAAPAQRGPPELEGQAEQEDTRASAEPPARVEMAVLVVPLRMLARRSRRLTVRAPWTRTASPSRTRRTVAALPCGWESARRSSNDSPPSRARAIEPTRLAVAPRACLIPTMDRSFRSEARRASAARRVPARPSRKRVATHATPGAVAPPAWPRAGRRRASARCSARMTRCALSRIAPSVISSLRPGSVSNRLRPVAHSERALARSRIRAIRRGNAR